MQLTSNQRSRISDLISKHIKTEISGESKIEENAIQPSSLLQPEVEKPGNYNNLIDQIYSVFLLNHIPLRNEVEEIKKFGTRELGIISKEQEI